MAIIVVSDFRDRPILLSPCFVSGVIFGSLKDDIVSFHDHERSRAYRNALLGMLLLPDDIIVKLSMRRACVGLYQEDWPEPCCTALFYSDQGRLLAWLVGPETASSRLRHFGSVVEWPGSGVCAEEVLSWSPERWKRFFRIDVLYGLRGHPDIPGNPDDELLGLVRDGAHWRHAYRGTRGMFRKNTNPRISNFLS